MLVLSRKLGEKLLIDTDIVVTILGVQGNRVRLGIEAPLQVPVLRSEIALADSHVETVPNRRRETA